MSEPHSIGPPRLYISDLCELLEGYLPQEQVQEVYRAYMFATSAHAGQMRRSGEEFIHHPIAVAYTLGQKHMDMETLCAALLHDVIEDTGMTKQDLIDEFGVTIADLVDGVSKLNRMDFKTREQAQAASFRKMVLAMSKDIRVIIIKLADRLHNIRTISSMKPDSRQRIARETLDIYAPIASRLGMNKIRLELEEFGFAALHPLRYRIIKRRLQKIAEKRVEHFKSIILALQQRLESYNFAYLAIETREKHVYALYKKLLELKAEGKPIDFQEVAYSYGFRIITDSVDNCYRTLGAIHSVYKPLTRSFEDHIAIPKSNGYQSLHTTVFSPYGRRADISRIEFGGEIYKGGATMELHIRTQTMQELIDNGIAAYGLYSKLEHVQYNQDIRLARERVVAWIQSLVDAQKNVEDSLEFIDHVKRDLLPEEVYVFTPQGKILQLPKGATALDFAYAVHTALGNRCIAVKVDDEYQTLYTPLESGQMVEIITAEWARPNADWLSFVVSAKARDHISAYLKKQNAHQAINLGKRLLNKQLLDYNLQVEKLDSEQKQQLMQYFRIDSWERLLREIGLGNVMSLVVVSQLNLGANNLPVYSKPLIISGSEGMVLSFARCCRPIPGDEIIGYHTAGKGIVVHTRQCKNVASFYHTQPERLLPVAWSENTRGEFSVDIQLEVRHQRGVLAEVGVLLADMNVNIEEIANENKGGLSNILRLCLAVKNRKHLAEIMRNLKQLDTVTKVQRRKS
jgi:GTP diphosphokinase / guanosine-3',5'-bis(diphosphate) 3'-diphosphatase